MGQTLQPRIDQINLLGFVEDVSTIGVIDLHFEHSCGLLVL